MGERITAGNEMVLVDNVVRVSPRVFPNQRWLTLAPRALSPAVTFPRTRSRFEALTIDDDYGQPEEASGAVQLVNDVLAEADHGGGSSPGDARHEDGGSWSTVKDRKTKTKEGISFGTMLVSQCRPLTFGIRVVDRRR